MALSLGIFLKQLSQDFLGDGPKISLGTAYQDLRALIETTIEGDAPAGLSEIQPDRDPIENWIIWGEFLRLEYEIEQYAFVMWDEIE